MNVFLAVIAVVTSGTSQHEVKRARVVAPVESTVDGAAVGDHDHDRLHRAPALDRARTATSTRSTALPAGVGRR